MAVFIEHDEAYSGPYGVTREILDGIFASPESLRLEKSIRSPVLYSGEQLPKMLATVQQRYVLPA